MLTGILTKLASFSLRNPKTILFGVLGVVLLGFGVHYKLLVGERDRLRIAEDGYKRAVAQFAARELQLSAAIELERMAAEQAIAQHEAARAALAKLRAGRQSDPEAQQWASQPIPAGERARLCEALPSLKGCE